MILYTPTPYTHIYRANNNIDKLPSEWTDSWGALDQNSFEITAHTGLVIQLVGNKVLNMTTYP